MDKYYVVCEDKCFIEAYSASEIDEMQEAKQNKVLYGTAEPTTDIGSDGDVYIMIE